MLDPSPCMERDPDRGMRQLSSQLQLQPRIWRNPPESAHDPNTPPPALLTLERRLKIHGRQELEYSSVIVTTAAAAAHLEEPARLAPFAELRARPGGAMGYIGGQHKAI